MISPQSQNKTWLTDLKGRSQKKTSINVNLLLDLLGAPLNTDRIRMELKSSKTLISRLRPNKYRNRKKKKKTQDDS